MNRRTTKYTPRAATAAAAAAVTAVAVDGEEPPGLYTAASREKIDGTGINGFECKLNKEGRAKSRT